MALAATGPAQATVRPIGGTDVGLERDPGNSIVARGNTNADGKISFRDLAPGHYTLTIDSKSLTAAIEKARSASADKKSSSSLTIGVGGMFGGGSSHSSSSHQDTKGGAAYGHPDKTTHSSSSGGGVGLGVSIPVGGSEKSAKSDGHDGTPFVSVRFVVGAKGDLGGGWAYTIFAPVCPGAPGDTRVGFDVKNDGGSVALDIGAEWQPVDSF
jgi:hypothetical protein